MGLIQPGQGERGKITLKNTLSLLTTEDSVWIICIQAMIIFICKKQGVQFEKEQAEGGNGRQTSQTDSHKSPLKLGCGSGSFIQVFEESPCVSFSCPSC